MLPFGNGCFINSGFVRLLSLVCLLAVFPSFHGASAENVKGKDKKKKWAATATPKASAGEQSLTNIPLPIGHEAKGLVLPDFDAEGRLRGRFEAERARRLDEEHVAFRGLKITTYTPENQVDLTVEMSESVFDLKTRILSSKERSTVMRSDFNITGDSVQFDTNARTGQMMGNVKMVITSQSQLLENQTK
jgi:hypothetical protein